MWVSLCVGISSCDTAVIGNTQRLSLHFTCFAIGVLAPSTVEFPFHCPPPLYLLIHPALFPSIYSPPSTPLYPPYLLIHCTFSSTLHSTSHSTLYSTCTLPSTPPSTLLSTLPARYPPLHPPFYPLFYSALYPALYPPLHLRAIFTGKPRIICYNDLWTSMIAYLSKQTQHQSSWIPLIAHQSDVNASCCSW